MFQLNLISKIRKSNKNIYIYILTFCLPSTSPMRHDITADKNWHDLLQNRFSLFIHSLFLLCLWSKARTEKTVCEMIFKWFQFSWFQPLLSQFADQKIKCFCCCYLCTCADCMLAQPPSSLLSHLRKLWGINTTFSYRCAEMSAYSENYEVTL